MMTIWRWRTGQENDCLMRLIDSLSPCRRFISSVFLGLSLIIAAGISARIIMTPHVLNQSTWEATGNARHLRRSWEAAKLPRLGRKLPVPSCDQVGLPTNVDPAIIFQCEAQARLPLWTILATAAASAAVLLGAMRPVYALPVQKVMAIPAFARKYGLPAQRVTRRGRS